MAETVRDWFHQNRGIDPETLEHFGVHGGPPKTNVPWWENGDPVLPYSNGEKTRRSPYDTTSDRPRFSFTKGVKPGLFNILDASKRTVFLVEGETDTMRLWQELHNEQGDNAPGVVGISGINTWRPDLVEAFEDATQVFVILDNDADYMVVAQVDAAWREIRRDFGPKATRLRLPEGVKDVCEFFDIYDLEILRMTAKKAGGAGQSRYKPLDLRQEPPPPNWLIDGLISKGDTTLIVGPSGIGKSWLTLGVTTAVAEGWTHFLSSEVQNVPVGGGRVLYVDQENPLDVVIHRLRKLGLTDTGQSNVRYLWNCGVRLDKDPERFLDEALDFQPTLIVLDSLTRLHTQDENSAGSMAGLMNDGIQQLARETGCATLLIHHDNKAGQPRGSVDIMASVDAALQCQTAGENNPGSFYLRMIKSRRTLKGSSLSISILDDEVAKRVHLKAEQPLNPPF